MPCRNVRWKLFDLSQRLRIAPMQLCPLGKMGWPTGLENVFAILDKTPKRHITLQTKGEMRFLIFTLKTYFDAF